MNFFSKSVLLGSILTGAATLGFADIQNASAEGFYKGKTIKMIVRSAPGGGYDFYGRLLA